MIREKRHVVYRRLKKRTTANFLSAVTANQKILEQHLYRKKKNKKQKNYQSRIIYPEKISFKIQCKIQTFSEIQSWKNLPAADLYYKKCLRGGGKKEKEEKEGRNEGREGEEKILWRKLIAERSLDLDKGIKGNRNDNKWINIRIFFPYHQISLKDTWIIMAK